MYKLKSLKCLGLIGGIAAISLVWCVTATAGEFNWGRFKGKNITVRMVVQKMVWSTLVSTWVEEFEQLTGIKAEIETLPEEQSFRKIGVEIATGGGLIDVLASSPAQDGIKYWRSGFIAPLDGYLKDPNWTAADYDANDFIKPIMEAMKYKGTILGLPMQSETGILFYRKDLFEKHGIKVPQTIDELEQAAKQLTLKGPDGKVEVYGVVNRGRREAAGGGTASVWLHNVGGDWLDKSGNPMLNSPEAVRAWETYTRIVRLYGPPGQANFQWHEAASFFAQGHAAMYMDGSSINGVLVDPGSSRVIGKIGYAKFPAGPVRDTPHIIGWGVNLTNSSKNKEAAWLLMQWLTNKRQTLRAQVAGASMTRVSAWESPEYKAVDKNPEWTRVSLNSMKIANPEWLPPIVAALEAKEIIGGIIQAGIQGQDVKAAADKANAELKALIEKTEKK